MAQFCLACWNQLMETNDPAKKYVFSREMDLCEGCGEWKTVILRVKWRYVLAHRLQAAINRKKQEDEFIK